MSDLEVWPLIALWVCTLVFAYLIGKWKGEHVGYISGLCFRSSELDD